MEILLAFAVGGLLFIGIFCMIDADHRLMSKRVPYSIFALAAILVLVMIGMVFWNSTGRTYRMHDVTVRVYYVDGSQKTIRLEGVSENIPYIDGRSHTPLFVMGRRYGSIPYIDRFDIIEERRYEMTGNELMNQKE